MDDEEGVTHSQRTIFTIILNTIQSSVTGARLLLAAIERSRHTLYLYPTYQDGRRARSRSIHRAHNRPFFRASTCTRIPIHPALPSSQYTRSTWRREQVRYTRSILTPTHHYIMVTDYRVLLFGPLLFCLFLVHHIRRVRQDWQAFGNLPTYSIFLSPLDTLSRIIPRIPRISGGAVFSWGNVYERQPLPSTIFSTQLTVCV